MMDYVFWTNHDGGDFLSRMNSLGRWQHCVHAVCVGAPAEQDKHGPDRRELGNSQMVPGFW